jgi:YHS domain-containing protein
MVQHSGTGTSCPVATSVEALEHHFSDGSQSMSDVSTLKTRIDSELAGLDDKIKHAQSERMEEHRERQDRLKAFEQRLETLHDVWKPRLEALVERFGDRVKATPHLAASSRDVNLDFQSDLARIHLRFSATTDHDVRKLILNYDLEIIPVLMQYNAHQVAEWPLDALDEKAIGDWVDDRIVEFVKNYLSLHENEYYWKEHMVVDPVAGVRFPKFAAASTVEWEGKTYHFMGDETRRQFEAEHKISPK